MIKIYKSKIEKTMFHLEKAVKIVNKLEQYYKPKDIEIKLSWIGKSEPLYSILVRTTEDIVEI